MRNLLLVLVVCSCAKPAAPASPPDASISPIDELRAASLPLTWTPTSTVDARYAENILKGDLEWKGKPTRLLMVMSLLDGSSEDLQLHSANGVTIAHLSQKLTDTEKQWVAGLRPLDVVALKCRGAGLRVVPQFDECIPEWVQPHDLLPWARSFIACVPYLRDGGTSRVGTEAQLRLRDSNQAQQSCDSKGIWVAGACVKRDTPECKAAAFLEIDLEAADIAAGLRGRP